jgi:uncharacterized Tic20 family protein
MSTDPAPAPVSSDPLKTNQWAMLLHLSQLLTYLTFGLGVIAPILIWQIKKSQMPELDAHGKIVVNWIISALIYGVVCFVLSFVVIGFFLGVALGAVAVIFPIVGGLKASNGEAWKYPLSITFLK